jgi:hypothetical protein
MGAPRSHAGSDRLPGGLACVREALAGEVRLSDSPEAERKFTKLRGMYEPYVSALSERLLMPLPPWIPSPEVHEYWRREI